MAKVLLHACCAVCASYPYKMLKEMGYEIVIYFYNPNIYPLEEYKRRLEELKKLCSVNNIKLIIEETSYEYWLNLVKGYEKEPEKGGRCTICFKERLSKAYAMALKEGCEFFTTTLTVSPHKSSKQIFEAANCVSDGQVCSSYDEKENSLPLKFLQIDFKKKDGFKKTSILADEYGFYRQKYCGCEFSIREYV